MIHFRNIRKENLMSKTSAAFSTRLFYSYSHKDADQRQSMEDALSLLRRQGILNTWSDLSIVPGQHISDRIREEINRANIIVFLLSHHFIASNACMEEWDSAKDRAHSAVLFRIPIILTDCPWPDLLHDDDIKALPDDAHPIDLFSSQAQAWQQVYVGIRAVIDTLRTTFKPKPDFHKEI